MFYGHEINSKEHLKSRLGFNSLKQVIPSLNITRYGWSRDNTEKENGFCVVGSAR